VSAVEAVQAATDAVRRDALTIGEILAHQQPLMDFPTFFKAASIPASTGYQVAAEGDLPIEVIRLGRRRYVRTVDAWRFLGLLPEGSAVAPGVQPGTPATGNDDAPGVQPGAPVQRINRPTS